MLSYQKGCTNSALLCEQVVDHLRAAFPGRFRLVEATHVAHIALDADHAELDAAGAIGSAPRASCCARTDSSITPSRIASDLTRLRLPHPSPAPSATWRRSSRRRRDPLCDLLSRVAENRPGTGVLLRHAPSVLVDGRERTLTCIGGPDAKLDAHDGYDPKHEYPEDVLEQLDAFIRPILAPGRSEPFAYDYAWHGLMAYTDDQVRRVGAEPRNPVLLYNLGCNGVGLLPSICGGERVVRLVAGRAAARRVSSTRADATKARRLRVSVYT